MFKGVNIDSKLFKMNYLTKDKWNLENMNGKYSM